MSDDPQQARVRQSATDRKILAASREAVEHSRQLLTETEPQTDPHRLIHQRNSVSLVHDGDEWSVLVDEEGQALVTRTFVLESYAVSYAEGQRIRLGLDQVYRIKSPSHSAEV